MGLTMCVTIDRKPVNGCEIQQSCDSRSQVMMQLKLEKSEADEDRYIAEIISDTAHQRQSVYMLHGMKVLIDLVKPWRNTWRTVCSDYYFASIPAINNLDKIGLHFVGVVKTNTKISYALLKLKLCT